MRDKDEALAAVFAEKAVRRGSPSASTPVTPELLHLTCRWYQKEQAVANWKFRLYSGFELRCLDSNGRYIRASGLVLYTYVLYTHVFVAGPNKHDTYWYSRSRGNFNTSSGNDATMLRVTRLKMIDGQASGAGVGGVGG